MHLHPAHLCQNIPKHVSIYLPNLKSVAMHGHGTLASLCVTYIFTCGVPQIRRLSQHAFSNHSTLQQTKSRHFLAATLAKLVTDQAYHQIAAMNKPVLLLCARLWLNAHKYFMGSPTLHWQS